MEARAVQVVRGERAVWVDGRRVGELSGIEVGGLEVATDSITCPAFEEDRVLDRW